MVFWKKWKKKKSVNKDINDACYEAKRIQLCELCARMKEWYKRVVMCMRKKAIFNAQPWNVARIVCLLRDSIANQLKQRKGIQLPKKHQWNEPLVIACVFMTTFFITFRFNLNSNSREIAEMEISSCAWWTFCCCVSKTRWFGPSGDFL